MKKIVFPFVFAKKFNNCLFMCILTEHVIKLAYAAFVLSLVFAEVCLETKISN